MARLWEPQSIEVYQSWLDTIYDEASDKLTSWETDFIENIGGRLAFGNNLTERQAEILERIYTEKTT
jgi:hypothetical protein